MNFIATPRPRAAYTVPANCPTPPSTTTMNESMMVLCPRSGPTLPICASAQPARPAIPEPSPNASRSTRAVGTPTHAAIVRFWVTPRTNRPRRVRDSTSHTAASTANAKKMMMIRLYGSVRLVNAMPPDIQDGLATSTFCAPKIWRTSWIRNRLMPQVASSVSSGRP